MNTTLLVAVRKQAEEAVADMPEGALKVKAFEVILASLLPGSSSSLSDSSEQKELHTKRPAAARRTSSLADRIGSLAEEGFFREPRGLAEIQAKLAEHGWHYPQQNLSTPQSALSGRGFCEDSKARRVARKFGIEYSPP